MLHRMGFLGGSVVKNLPANAGDASSIPEPKRSSAEGNGNLFHYSCLKNFMDRGAWRATDHGVTTVRHDLSTEHHTHTHTHKDIFLLSLHFILSKLLSQLCCGNSITHLCLVSLGLISTSF